MGIGAENTKKRSGQEAVIKQRNVNDFPCESFKYFIRSDAAFHPEIHLDSILRAFASINEHIWGGCLILSGEILSTRESKKYALLLAELIDAHGLSRQVFIPGGKKPLQPDG